MSPTVAQAPSLLVNVEEVCRLLSVSRTTLWRAISAGRFPRPLDKGALDQSSARWKRSTIEEFVSKL